MKAPIGITVEELILAPRAICNALITIKEIWLKYPLAEDKNVYGDVLFTLRALHNQHTHSVHPNVNYIYHKHPSSIQNSKPNFYHRMRHIQTVARFCQLENIEPRQAIRYLEMAMLNVKYGSDSLKLFRENHPPNELRNIVETEIK